MPQHAARPKKPSWDRFANAAGFTGFGITAVASASSKARRLDKYEAARSLLREREGDISKGVPISARSTRLTVDEAAKDVATDYTVNGRRSKDNVERRIKLHLWRRLAPRN